MPYTDLTITRSDIDAYEGVTFANYNETSTTLKIDVNDAQVLAAAQRELKTDLIDKCRHLYENGTYASEEAVLDDLYANDADKQLEQLLTFKFLELWFKQDSDSKDSLSWDNFQIYHSKYTYFKDIAVRRLMAKLSTPVSSPRIIMRSIWN